MAPSTPPSSCSVESLQEYQLIRSLLLLSLLLSLAQSIWHAVIMFQQRQKFPMLSKSRKDNCTKLEIFSAKKRPKSLRFTLKKGIRP
jgi:hypothetical protein